METKYKPANVKVLTNPTPKIADVQCHRVKFEPGDRVVVRIYQKLDSSQTQKLRKSVEKWAGDVEVIVVDCTVYDLSIDKSKGILVE